MNFLLFFFLGLLLATGKVGLALQMARRLSHAQSQVLNQDGQQPSLTGTHTDCGGLSSTFANCDIYHRRNQMQHTKKTMFYVLCQRLT